MQSETESMESVNRDDQIFFSSKMLRSAGLGGLLFFFPLTIWLIWSPIANADGSFSHPMLATIFGGCFSGGFALLAAYLLLSYRRLRLIVSSSGLQLTTAFHIRSVSFADITKARWRGNLTGGSVVICTPGQRVVVEFENFEDRNRLRELLHHSIPSDVQENSKQHQAALDKGPKPIVITGRTSLIVSMASLLLAIVFWAGSNIHWARGSLFAPMLLCPSIALATSIDGVRRPRLRSVFTMLMAWTAVGFLLSHLHWFATA